MPKIDSPAIIKLITGIIFFAGSWMYLYLVQSNFFTIEAHIIYKLVTIFFALFILLSATNKVTVVVLNKLYKFIPLLAAVMLIFLFLTFLLVAFVSVPMDQPVSGLQVILFIVLLFGWLIWDFILLSMFLAPSDQQT